MNAKHVSSHYQSDSNDYLPSDGDLAGVVAFVSAGGFAGFVSVVAAVFPV
jgi:hypothetical protein